MEPFHVTDLPHNPTTLMPNGVLYEVYVTYASHQNDTRGMRLCFWFTLRYIQYVGLKYYSRKAWKGKCILKFTNIREIDLIERQ